MSNKEVSVSVVSVKNILIAASGFLLIGFVLTTYAIPSPADAVAKGCVGPLQKYLRGGKLSAADNAALSACYQNGSCTNNNLAGIVNTQGQPVCAQALNEWQNKYSSVATAAASPDVQSAASHSVTSMAPAPATMTTTTTTAVAPTSTVEPAKAAPATAPFTFKDTNNAVPAPTVPITSSTTTHTQTTTTPEKTDATQTQTPAPATTPEKKEESVNWF